MGVLGLGLAALGRPEYLTVGHGEAVAGRYDPAALEVHCHEVLDAAWAGGVRHLDVARSYGAAERFLGTWLARHPGRRELLTVGSKWGYAYVAAFRRAAEVHEVKEHSTGRLGQQWPETLHALGGPPDHYLVHSVTPDSAALQDGPLLERLADLAATGVRIGLSTSGPRQDEVVDAALSLDVYRSVQSTWNVLEPSVGPALDRAHAAGWFVVVKEALANGRLLQDQTPLDAGEGCGAGRDALALAAALAQPWADVVLSGAATVTQLQENLRALTAPAEAVDAVLRATASSTPDPQAYWRTRSAMPWS